MATELSARRLLTRGALLRVWLPVLCIGILHYTAPHGQHWVHDLARRLFYVPIVLAGTMGGMTGGLSAATVVLATYAPHALMRHAFTDPGSHSEKLLEMVFYVVLGALSGSLAERSRREQKRQAELTAEVEVKDDQLARAARLESLGQLTAGLAHEIKNPLHAMRGTAEVLTDFVPEGSDARPLAIAHIAEIDRLDGLLTNFLDFARGTPPQVEAVQLAEVANTVADLVRAQATRQGVEVDVTAERSTVMADRELLVQVVLGLAINAMQSGARTVRIAVPAGGSNISVENDGPPIPKDELARVFDPFFSTREAGTGLGLSTAWRIVQSHAGSIDVDNLPDSAGVRFVVSLPGQLPPSTGEGRDIVSGDEL